MLLDSTLGNVEGFHISIVESNPVDNKHYIIFSKVITSAHKSQSSPPTGLQVLDNLCFWAARMALCRPDQDQRAPVLQKNLFDPGNGHI